METADSSSKQSRHIRTCQRCGRLYDWRSSPSSSLKMTYCGSLCECADLGFTIEAVLRRQAPEPASAEAAQGDRPEDQPVQREAAAV